MKNEKVLEDASLTPAVMFISAGDGGDFAGLLWRCNRHGRVAAFLSGLLRVGGRHRRNHFSLHPRHLPHRQTGIHRRKNLPGKLRIRFIPAKLRIRFIPGMKISDEERSEKETRSKASKKRTIRHPPAKYKGILPIFIRSHRRYKIKNIK